MGFEVMGLRGAPGHDWARHQIFGADTSTVPDLVVFRKHLASPCREIIEALTKVGDRIEGRAADTGSFGPLLKEISDSLVCARRSLERGIERLYASDTDRPFRVVFMGRTMAGKSTLFEFFTLGDLSRIGQGQQRVTTEACLRQSESLGFDVVDTPGVGALDGAADYVTAFAQVPDADLILWVMSDDATQEETARALRELGVLGKPVLVALNIRADLDKSIEWDDFLHEPELIFSDDKLGNLRPIERHLASVGGRPLGVVPVHADAALRSRSDAYGVDVVAALRLNSRVDDLLLRLSEEQDRTSSQRRTLSMCDQVRVAMLDAAATVRAAGRELQVEVERARGGQSDFRRQAKRRVDDAQVELSSAIRDIVGRRERWWEDFKIDDNVTKLWRKETQQIQGEVDEAMKSSHARLFADLSAINSDVADDWAAFRPGEFHQLPGYGEVWGHRVLKTARTLAAPLAFAAAGAALGSVVPGIGNLVGGAIGGIVGGLVELIPGFGKLLDSVFSWFKSKAEINRRRREEVRKQLRPVLTQIESTLMERVRDVVAEWNSMIDGEVGKQAGWTTEVERAAVRLAKLDSRVSAALADVDLLTARRLLDVSGRSRVATQAVKATRWQGVGVAVSLTEPGYTEQVLFPLDVGEWVVPVSSPDKPPSESALAALQGLVSGPITVQRIAATELEVELGSPIPAGICEAWASLVQLHCGVRPTIRSRENS